MSEVYHIRIQQVGGPEAMLEFPSRIDHLVSKLFQERYRTGQEFLNAIEQANQPILDAFTVAYPSEGKVFTYSIRDDKLVLGLVVGQGEEGIMRGVLSQHCIIAMGLMAQHLGNYLHIKETIDPTNKPVNIQRTYDDMRDQGHLNYGREAKDELRTILQSIFDGKEPEFEGKYIVLEEIVTGLN